MLTDAEKENENFQIKSEEREIRVGFSQCLKHVRHEASFGMPPSMKTHHMALPEMSLYRLSRFLEKGFLFPKDRSLEKVRSVFFLKAREVDLLHSYNRLVMNHMPWILDLESFDRLFPQLEWLSPNAKTTFISRALRSPYCRKILPWSRFSETTLRQYIQDPEVLRKVKVLYPTVNPVSSDNGHSFSDSSPVRFLFVGFDFHRKGGDWLLKAFNRLKPKAHLMLVTHLSGVDQEGVKKENITLMKPLPRSVLLQEVFPKADVLVLPARSEAFGLVCLEAMSHGLPVVATDIGALPEMVIDGETGFLLHLPDAFHEISKKTFELKRNQKTGLLEEATRASEEGTVSHLHALLDRLAQDAALRRRLGQTGRERFEQVFSPEQHHRQLRTIYEEALS